MQETDKEIFEKDAKDYLPVFNRYKIVLDHGEGAYLWDNNGKKYLDFLGGIAVNVLGHDYGPLVTAISEQAKKLIHCSNLYYTQPQADAAAKLVALSGLDKAFFGNSGAEANEGAIKIARKYAHQIDPEKSQIITAWDSFHGRTIATLTATGQPKYHEGFGPLPDGFDYVHYNDIEELESMMSEKTAAVMLETIQGEGGVHPLDKDFFEGVNKYAKEHDILLIVDEVQTGNGRTGKLYGYMNFDVQPDIVSTAKGLGGGLPIGATMLSEKTQDVFTYGTHGSTFGGNPIACAGAVSILKEIDDALLASVKEKGDYIKKEMEGSKGVKSVAGMGLMLGIEPVAPVGPIVEKLLAKGVVVLTAKEKIRLLPALNIPMEQLKKAVAIMKDVLAEE